MSKDELNKLTLAVKIKIADSKVSDFLDSMDKMNVSSLVLTSVRDDKDQFALSLNSVNLDNENIVTSFVHDFVRHFEPSDPSMTASLFVRYLHIFMAKLGAKSDDMISFHQSVIKMLEENKSQELDDFLSEKPIKSNGDGDPTLH